MIAPSYLFGKKMGKIIRFGRAHKRVVAFLLVFAYAVFLLVRPDELGRFVDLLFLALLVMFIASQVFWVRRVLDLVERIIPGKSRRAWLAVIASLVYLFFFVYWFPSVGIGHRPRAADPRLRSILTVGAFSWWVVGSFVGFSLVMVFWAVDRAMRVAAWVHRKVGEAVAGHAAASKPDVIALGSSSPTRRRFLKQTAMALSAAPFVASAYGLLYGRLDMEVTHRSIRLKNLPKAFEGFRIAQLSDFHISPFMPANQIRRWVTMTNQLNADLVVLTGDYTAWDPAAQRDVVQALAGLRAPHGVFGCLGNHETELQTEESTARLFAAQGIRILRQESAPIRLRGEILNLVGVDDSLTELQVIEPLVIPDTVNILLAHDPNTFDRAVKLGIDLTLAGHTHGGQLSLEFVHRGLSLARLETPYVSGWYEKPGGQLYVNRGIGTTGFPIRLGARPEITLLELTRGA